MCTQDWVCSWVTWPCCSSRMVSRALSESYWNWGLVEGWHDSSGFTPGTKVGLSLCVCVCGCTWVSLRSNPLHHNDIIPNSSPVIPTPRTKTSLEQSFTGVGVARSGGERTKRNPRCWKKCLRKENRLNRDASSPVETQDPPLWEGGEMRVYSIKNCQKWIFNVKHLTGLDIRNALIKHIGSSYCTKWNRNIWKGSVKPRAWVNSPWTAGTTTARPSLPHTSDTKCLGHTPGSHGRVRLPITLQQALNLHNMYWFMADSLSIYSCFLALNIDHTCPKYLLVRSLA